MLKVNDGGDQESPVARPFVVVVCSSSVISIGSSIGSSSSVVGSRGGCKVREGKQVQGR
jgi:hypothetical protein